MQDCKYYYPPPNHGDGYWLQSQPISPPHDLRSPRTCPVSTTGTPAYPIFPQSSQSTTPLYAPAVYAPSNQFHTPYPAPLLNQIASIPSRSDCLVNPYCQPYIRNVLPVSTKRPSNIWNWVRSLFGCAGVGVKPRLATNPQHWRPSERRLVYLRQSKALRKDKFSARFLAETKAAMVGSRLNVDMLVKESGDGLLTTQSLESLELEMLEKSCSYPDLMFRYEGDGFDNFQRSAASWQGSQPVLYGFNTHNSTGEKQKIETKTKKKLKIAHF